MRSEFLFSDSESFFSEWRENMTIVSHFQRLAECEDFRSPVDWGFAVLGLLVRDSFVDGVEDSRSYSCAAIHVCRERQM